MRFAEIAISGPLKKTFTYSAPASITRIELGQRVLVPFGRMQKIGYYLGSSRPAAGLKIKAIIKVIDESSYFAPELFQLCSWIADYYFANPADVLTSALPSAIRKSSSSRLIWKKASVLIPAFVGNKAKPNQKLTSAVIQEINRYDPKLLTQLKRDGVVTEIWPENSPQKKRILGYRLLSAAKFRGRFSNGKSHPEIFDGVKPKAELRQNGWTDYQLKKAVLTGILEAVTDTTNELPLSFVEARHDVTAINPNPEQSRIINKLREELDKGHQVSLLHGVTGSGKTLVYCHLAGEALKRGKTVLVLTPEIALAGATLAYFRGFFSNEVTVIHSSMTGRERLESWQGLSEGRYKIAVGPRSALFAPMRNLGLIIVDEEHDETYKQDDPAPRFHTRDAAIMRANINDIPILLGTASPSLESYYNASIGRYRLFELTKRPGQATLPNVHIVDMKSNRIGGDLSYISYPMKKTIEKCLEKNEQVILYLNRRGYSPFIKCSFCGFVPSCPNCKVNLTYHKSGSKLSCHYCGKLVTNFDICPSCGGNKFEYRGVGTQKVEENIRSLFEKGKPVRLDSDTAVGRTKAYDILSGFAERKNNMLLGTQMVTKGLDLPGVSLVGVLSADQSLDLPDFRSSERSFARLLQVAGRSGRADNKGQVLIQTYYPERDVIVNAAKQDYKAFYEQEIAARQRFNYPPFTRLVNFVLSGKNEKKLEIEAQSFCNRLQKEIKSAKLVAELLGPAPCPLYFLRKSYRRHLFVKTTKIVRFVRMLANWEDREPRFSLPSAIRIAVDVDPHDMM